MVEDDYKDASFMLHRLVLAVGHAVDCPATSVPCTCGKAAVIREAHGDACRLLRELGLIK